MEDNAEELRQLFYGLRKQGGGTAGCMAVFSLHTCLKSVSFASKHKSE